MVELVEGAMVQRVEEVELSHGARPPWKPYLVSSLLVLALVVVAAAAETPKQIQPDGAQGEPQVQVQVQVVS